MEESKKLTITVIEREDECMQWGTEAVLQALTQMMMNESRREYTEEEALSCALDRAIYETGVVWLGLEETERIWANARRARRGNEVLPAVGEEPAP